jgi:DNA helicase INO80
MDSNFHTTVLQQPRHFGEDNTGNSNREDRGRLRDILNPGGSVSPAPAGVPGHQPPTIMSTPSGTSQGPPPAPTPPARPHHHATSFSLRSPTQSSDFHNQPPPPPSLSYSTSPSNNNVAGSRSILNNHYMTSPAGGTSLPPPLQPPAGIVTSSSGSVGPPASGTSNLHAPDRSPLHAPPVYYPHDIRDRDRDRERDRDLREPSREKASTGSFYDPTTDSVTTSNGTTIKERRISDAAGSWHNNGAPKVSTPKVSPNFFSTLNSTCRHPITSLSKLALHNFLS